jgi:hypothetical protein
VRDKTRGVSTHLRAGALNFCQISCIVLKERKELQTTALWWNIIGEPISFKKVAKLRHSSMAFSLNIYIIKIANKTSIIFYSFEFNSTSIRNVERI